MRLFTLKVVVDCMTEFQQDTFLACYAETTVPAIYQYSVTQVKDKLLEVGGLRFREHGVF